MVNEQQPHGESVNVNTMSWRELETYVARQFGRRSLIDTGNYMRRAMLELAFEIGGQDLVSVVGPTVLDRTTVLPSGAIAEFEHNRPGITTQIMDLSGKIQQRKHREDWMRKLTGRKLRSTEDLLEEPLTANIQTRLRTVFQRKGRQA